MSMHPFECYFFKPNWKFYANILKYIPSCSKLLKNSKEDHFIQHSFNPHNCIHCAGILARYFTGKNYLEIQNYSKEQLLDLVDNEDSQKYIAETACLFFESYNYQLTKNIYDIDEELEKLLNKTKLNNIPTNYLNVPKGTNCVLSFKNDYISITQDLKGIIFSQHKKKENNYISKGIFLYIITDGVEYLNDILNREEAQEFSSIGFDLIKKSVNTLLYILGDADVVKEVHPGANPKKKNIFTYQDKVYGKSPTIHKVGKKYRKLIERYELDFQEPHIHNGNKDTGRTVRPHIRGAHFQGFWTGRGRQILEIKFVMACFVQGKSINLTDLDDTDISEVK